MGNIVKKWTGSSLVLKIVIGLIIGVILGVFVKSATWVGIFGTLFVGALKGVAPILVFCLVASALSNSGSGVGSRFRTVIILYIVSTLMGAVTAVIMSYAFPVTMVLGEAVEQSAPMGLGEVVKTLLGNLVTNPITSIANANYIGVLFWAVVLGIALKKCASENTKNFVADMASAVSIIVKGIIQFAPFGIMGLVFSAVSESGLAIFVDYGKLVLLLVSCMLIVALVVNPIIVAVTIKKNPYPLVFRTLKESGITAFFTRSSAANIPINMQLSDRLGLDEDFYSVSIPLGATINMDGAAITITIMSLAVCHTMGINVGIPTAIALSFIATLGACGASGVAGGSLLLIPMACALFGVSNDVAMQAVGVGFIIGVIQDSMETALNSSTDVLLTATAEYYDRKKRGEDMDYNRK